MYLMVELELRYHNAVDGKQATFYAEAESSVWGVAEGEVFRAAVRAHVWRQYESCVHDQYDKRD